MRKKILMGLLVLVLSFAFLGPFPVQAKTHIIDKWHKMVHAFNAKDPVILTVVPGDTVIAETRFITDPNKYWGPNTTLEESCCVKTVTQEDVEPYWIEVGTTTKVFQAVKSHGPTGKSTIPPLPSDLPSWRDVFNFEA